MIDSAVLALYGSGLRSGIVVAAGASYTRVVAVWEGFPLKNCDKILSVSNAEEGKEVFPLDILSDPNERFFSERNNIVKATVEVWKHSEARKEMLGKKILLSGLLAFSKAE